LVPDTPAPGHTGPMSMPTHPLQALIVSLAVAAVDARPASACECAFDAVTIVSPAPGEVVDPLRPVIATALALSFREPEVVSSTPVETTVVALAGGDFLIVARPVGPMADGAVDIEILDGGESLASIRFTVDADAAQAPGAAVPSIAGASIQQEFSGTLVCSDYLFYDLAVEAPGAVVFLQDVGVVADDADALASSTLSLGLRAGNANCVRGWPEAALSSSIATRVLAVGVDGTITAFSEPFTVVTPTDDDCDGLADDDDDCPAEAGASPGCPADGVSPWACVDDPTRTCAPNGRICEASAVSEGEGFGEGFGEGEGEGEGCATSPPGSAAALIALLAVLGGRKRRTTVARQAACTHATT
jgi:uncharacterized protein (TIGR03382 family)